MSTLIGWAGFVGSWVREGNGKRLSIILSDNPTAPVLRLSSAAVLGVAWAWKADKCTNQPQAPNAVSLTISAWQVDLGGSAHRPA